MKRSLFLLVTLLSTCFTSFSQVERVDSILTAFNEGTKEERVILAREIEEIAKQYANSSLDSCIYFCEQVIPNIINTKSNNKTVAKLYSTLSTCQKNSGDFESAFESIKNAIELAKVIEDKRMELSFEGLFAAIQIDERNLEGARQTLNEILVENDKTIKSGYVYARTYSEIGALEYRNRNYYMASNNYLKALEYKDSCKSAMLRYINSGLSYTYLNSGEYSLAIKFFQDNYQSAESENNQCDMMQSLKNIALAYARADSIQKSEAYNLKAEKLEQKCGSLMQMDLAFNMTTLYNRKGNEKKELEYALKAKRLADDVNQDIYISYANAFLAKAYAKNGLISKADKALRQLEASKVDNIQIKTLQLEAEYLIEKKKGSYKNSLEIYEKHTTLKDSIEKSNKKSDIKLLTKQFELTQKENENLLLQQEKQDQELKTSKANQRNILLGLGFLFALIIGGIAFASYRKSEKQKSQIILLQRDLHHRIKNNFSLADVFLETAEEKIEDNNVRGFLNELRNRLNSLVEVHEQLAYNEDITAHNLHMYLNKLTQRIASSYSNSNIDILLDVPKSIAMESNKSFPIGLMVNEFITNSFKYAFPINQKGKVHIILEEVAEDYHLIMKDNGIGIPVDFDINNTEQLGMRTMMLLSQQLNGSFRNTNDNGVTIDIKFPK